MPINLGFGDVPRNNLKPTGDYIVTIESFAYGPSKATKDLPEDQQEGVAHVKYVIDSPSEFNGQKMQEWISFAPAALWSARDWLEALLGEEIDGDFELDETGEEYVGHQIGLTLDDQGEYPKGSGKAQNRIIGHFTV